MRARDDHRCKHDQQGPDSPIDAVRAAAAAGWWTNSAWISAKAWAAIGSGGSGCVQCGDIVDEVILLLIASPPIHLRCWDDLPRMSASEAMVHAA